MLKLLTRAIDEIKYILLRVGELELLDRGFAIGAQGFVALLPVFILVTEIFAGENSGDYLSDELINRFDFEGTPAAVQIRVLLGGIGQGAFYLPGALIALYSAFSMSRRVARTYNAIWKTPQLRKTQQWRGAAWIGLQLALAFTLTQIRSLERSVDNEVVFWLLFAACIAVFWCAEYQCQRMLTQGAVAKHRMVWATSAVTVARLGVWIYTLYFLAESLAIKAEQFGPIGVVFALFTMLYTWVLGMLGATLIAACLTDPDRRNLSTEESRDQLEAGLA